MEIEYVAPETCPSREAFLAEVRARTAWTDSKGRVAVVHIAGEGSSWKGTVALRANGSESEPRSLEAPSCDDAARALALAVALLADDEPPPPVVIVAAPPASRAPPAERAPTLPPPSRPWRISAGVIGDARGMASPGAVAGLGVEVSVAPSPIVDLRASFRQTIGSSIDHDGTHTTLSWTVGRFEPCFFDWRVGPMGLGPCVFAELGQVRASGDGLPSRGRLWGDAGLEGRAAVELGSRVALRGALGGFVPFDASTFAYEPSLVVWRAPSVVLAGSLGFFVFFP